MMRLVESFVVVVDCKKFDRPPINSPVQRMRGRCSSSWLWWLWSEGVTGAVIRGNNVDDNDVEWYTSSNLEIDKESI